MLPKSMALAVLLLTASALGSQLFPFNIDGQAGFLSYTEDGCTSNFSNGEQFRLLGQTVDFIYVCTNGVVSFTYAMNSYSPVPFPVSGKVIVAPFWADASILNNVGGDSGRVYYEMVSISSTEAETLAQLVRDTQGASQFSPTRIYQATWNQVGYYNAHADPHNSFQVAILTDESAFYAIFNYPEGGINWVLPDDAINYPVAGVNLGDGTKHISLPFSGENVATASTSSNVGIDGIWILRIDEVVDLPTQVPTPVPTQVPTPVPTQAPTSVTTLSSLFPYNVDGQAGYLSGSEDDCSGGLEGLIYLFGESFNTVYVCANGYISLGRPESVWDPTPFPVTGKNFIAPFWADVSTVSNVGEDSGRVYYEMIPTWSASADKFNQYVRSSDPSNAATSQFVATRIYQATWNKVGYYDAQSTPHNSFQAVIITDESQYFVIFNYPENGINWLLAQDAINYPVAGVNLWDGANYINLPFSGSDFSSAISSSNIGVPGVWVLHIAGPIPASTPSAVPANSPTASPSPTLPFNAMVYRNYYAKSNGLGYAISASGDQVAVAQPMCSEVMGYDKPCGKVYLLNVNYGGWELTQHFQYLGRVASSEFGANVLLQNGWLLVQSSAPYDFATGTEQSAVYGFQFSAAHGRYIRRFSLSPPTSQNFQYFGEAFAMDGNFTIISSKWHNTDGYTMSGIAYVYHYPKSVNRTSGPRYQTIKSPNVQSYENFGQSIAAKDGTLLISTFSYTSRAVYVFKYDLDRASHVQTILPNMYSFGNDMAFNGADLFVGSYLDSSIHINGGSVYHFTKNYDGTFSQQEVLTPYDGTENTQFGVSIAYDAEQQLLVVGATGTYQCSSCFDKGAVYALKRSALGYWEQVKHSIGKANGSDLFGYSVATTNHGILVGAPYDSTHGPNRGAIYMIRH